MENNELAHYGILGMKWGIRRTPAQLARARGSSGKKTGASAGDKKKSASKASTKTTKEKTEEQPKKKKPLSEMTEDEIRKEINRLQLEKSYRELLQSSVPKTQPKQSKAKDLVTEILTDSTKNIGKQAVTYVMGTAVNKALGGLFNDDAIVNPKKGQKDK